MSSRASRTISRNPLEAQLRNTRTAAGFGHMPSKTHAEKMLHVTFQAKRTPKKCFTSPLEAIKQQSFVLSSKQNHCRNPLEAQLRNTRTAAGFGHMPSKTHAEKMLHVTFGIHKTTIFCPLEQAEPLAEIPWRRSCETLEQQQDSGTCQAKRTPKKCFTSPLESIKQQSFVLSSKQNH